MRTTIKVEYANLSSFDQKDREVLVSYADLLSQDDLESRIVLYSTSIYQIFEEWSADKEESGVSEKLAGFCKSVYSESVDMYIFE